MHIVIDAAIDALIINSKSPGNRAAPSPKITLNNIEKDTVKGYKTNVRLPFVINTDDKYKYMVTATVNLLTNLKFLIS